MITIEIYIYEESEDACEDVECSVSDDGDEFDDVTCKSFKEAIEEATARSFHYGDNRCRITRDGIQWDG